MRQLSRVLRSFGQFNFLRQDLVMSRANETSHKDLSTEIQGIRPAYKSIDQGFDIAHLVSTSDPLTQFSTWLSDALVADSHHPNEVALATATPGGMPSLRMVLLKGFGVDGFVFFTNYSSQKSKELLANPHAAMLFYWSSSNRQIRIEGDVETTSPEESDEYFSKRPLISQVSAAISPQGEVIADRAWLVDKYKECLNEVESSGEPVTRPSNWGGWRLKPRRYEFWQGQTSRLHDRLVFTREDNGWLLQRLAP